MQKVRMLTLVGVWALASLSVQATWLNGWEFRRVFTVDAGQVDEDLVDFPVTVRLTPSELEFGQTREDGHDIRFTAADGVTLLDYECELYNPAVGAAIYWVRLPLVSSSSDTTFYLYYGNPRAPDGAHPAGVWDDGHVAVWHLGASNGVSQADSTANGHHLNLYGAVSEGVAGVVGAGVHLADEAETPQYLANPPGAFPSIDTTAGLTFSAWAYPTKHGTVINCGGGNWAPWWRTTLFGSANYLYGYSSIPGSANHGAGGQNWYGFTLDAWSHVAMTLDYNANTNESTLRLYLNGNEVRTHSVTNRSFRNPFTGRPIVIGGRTHNSWPANNPDGLFGGTLDEARVSNVRRSAAWIRASFNNQKPDSTLVQSGSAESVAAWYTNWKHRRSVMIDSEQIDEDLVDFPVLVRLTSKVLNFEMARHDGFDIRFTAADGATPLNYEREFHDAADGTALYWVRLPLISSTANTIFYLYFDNPKALDGANPAGVWGNDHVAVWHLGTSNGVSQADASANSHHLNLYGNVDEGTPGIVGQAIGLDGVSTTPSYLATPPGAFPTFDTAAGLTYSAWACPTNDASTDNTRAILSIGGGNWSPYWSYYFGYYRDNQMRGYASGFGSGYVSHGDYGQLGTGFERDVWSHVAMSVAYDDTAQQSTMRLYVNGSEILSHTIEGNSIRPSLTGRPMIIGGTTFNPWPNTDPNWVYSGWIDEARISNVPRSPAWLAASYHNQKFDSTMLGFGCLEPPTGTVVFIR